MSGKKKRERSQLGKLQPIGRWIAEIRIGPNGVKLPGLFQED
jgi:hypothetical protein